MVSPPYLTGGVGRACPMILHPSFIFLLARDQRISTRKLLPPVLVVVATKDARQDRLRADEHWFIVAAQPTVEAHASPVARRQRGHGDVTRQPRRHHPVTLRPTLPLQAVVVLVLQLVLRVADARLLEHVARCWDPKWRPPPPQQRRRQGTEPGRDDRGGTLAPRRGRKRGRPLSVPRPQIRPRFLRPSLVLCSGSVGRQPHTEASHHHEGDHFILLVMLLLSIRDGSLTRRSP